MNTPLTTQEQAVATLQHYFHQQVAEAMPKAIRASLADAQGLGHWLHMATLRIPPSQFGPLDADDVPMLGGLSSSSLLVLLFDQRQPAGITAAARDVLLGRYLADEDVQAATIAQANVMARQAVQELARTQAFARAERTSLYGDEHAVPGVAPAPSARTAQTGSATRTFVTLLAALAAGTALVLMLAGCGGGGDENEQPEQPTPAVDCQAKPEACK